MVVGGINRQERGQEGSIYLGDTRLARRVNPAIT